MMTAPVPPRIDNIEIPDRPATVSRSEEPRLTRKQVLLYGGIAAVALLIVVAIALSQSATDEVARGPADAPLIKAEDQPFKVSPVNPGGMEVPNRDILLYERLHGTKADKRVLERLMPEAEQPQTPPAAHRPTEMAETSSASEADSSLAPDEPGIESLVEPPMPEHPARPMAETTKAPPAVAANPKLSPSPSPPPSAVVTTPAKPAPPAQVKVATAPASASSATQPDKPASGKGFQLQLLSSRSADEAKGAWARLRDKNGDLLGPLSPSVARANLGDRGTFYRLRAGPVASESKARSICDSLSARGVSCLVVRSSG
jgi:cell division septation protein DedD